MNEVMIGFDPNFRRAWNVTANSIIQNAKIPPSIRPIGMSTLPLYRRETRREGGKLWDGLSDAPMSTEFSLARFFVPFVADAHWVLFCDGDFLFRADIAELFDLADMRYAVQVVKHEHHPIETTKMDGRIQTDYRRKNWSSLILWNMRHAAANRLKILDANTKSGLWLHQLSWLHDDEIGELPPEWNHLVGFDKGGEDAKALHFSEGTPDLPWYENCYFSDEWRRYDYDTR